jgi:hypothetical protein
MTYKELKDEVFSALKNKPKEWRKGQFVFNYIDSVYGVAREAQYVDGIDCFYKDEIIEAFLQCCAEKLKSISSHLHKLAYNDAYIIVQWPEIQHLMEIEGFRNNSYLVNDLEGIDKFGSSAYFVNINWLKDNNIIK